MDYNEWYLQEMLIRSENQKRRISEKFGETVKCRRCMKFVRTENSMLEGDDSFMTLKVKCENCLKSTIFNSMIDEREITKGADLQTVINRTSSDIVSGPRSTIDSLPEIADLSHCNLVYFHIETSGFSSTADILQIRAKCEECTFNVYVNSTQPVEPKAFEVNGFMNIKGKLFQKEHELLTIPVKDALTSFQEFLNLFSKPCVLVAHNRGFHFGIFFRAVINNSMIDYFTEIAGFADSCVSFKKLFPKRKGKGMFTLKKLAEDFLKNLPDGNFHESLYDIMILEQLVSTLSIKAEDLIRDRKRYKEYMMERLFEPHLVPLEGVVSNPIIKKLALAGITFETLRNIYRTQGKAGIVELLSNRRDNGPAIVTKNQIVIDNIIGAL